MREWRCKQCGLCCKQFSIVVKGNFSEGDLEFFNSHANMAAIAPDILVFKGKCKHLGYKNGKHYCKIYDKRPKICREFGEEHCKSMHIIAEELKK